MTTDKQTNYVYISSLLKEKCPKTYRQLIFWFEKFNIAFGELKKAKDLWLVDFMPLQIRENYFVQYKYNPDYLQYKKYQKTISNQEEVCNEINLFPNKFSISLDGGNVVKSNSKVIMTTKIFKENPNYLEQNLINEIRNQLQVEQVIIIPQEPNDFVGHSDGMVRFIDESTVLVNQYPKQKDYLEFGYSLRWSLRNAGLNFVEFPYDSWQNETSNDATGCYINFLEIGNYIFYPVFGKHSDQFALIQLQNVFKDRQIIDIECNELAKLGGVLNCATWNILK